MEEEFEEKENKIFKEIVEWCFCIFIALILALLTRYYIATPTMVKQTSMVPTLEENQRIILSRRNRITKEEYERGDIITFQAPNETRAWEDIVISNPVAVYNDEKQGVVNKFIYNVLEINKLCYIKRIIAVGGDKIQIKNGNVYVNDELLIEDYLPTGTTTKGVYYNNIIVPEGYVYVMGDNRDESVDSRTFGCIPIEQIEGKIVFRYWPVTKFGVIK